MLQFCQKWLALLHGSVGKPNLGKGDSVGGVPVGGAIFTWETEKRKMAASSKIASWRVSQAVCEAAYECGWSG